MLRYIHEHELKILPKYLIDIERGIKTFEVRFNDRNFQVGDVLRLKEFFGGEYTGREHLCRVCYILDDPAFVKEGFVILGIREV